MDISLSNFLHPCRALFICTRRQVSPAIPRVSPCQLISPPRTPKRGGRINQLSRVLPISNRWKVTTISGLAGTACSSVYTFGKHPGRPVWRFYPVVTRNYRPGSSHPPAGTWKKLSGRAIFASQRLNPVSQPCTKDMVFGAHHTHNARIESVSWEPSTNRKDRCRPWPPFPLTQQMGLIRFGFRIRVCGDVQLHQLL